MASDSGELEESDGSVRVMRGERSGDGITCGLEDSAAGVVDSSS